MTGDELAQLGYLSILGIVIVAYFIIANRRAIGKVARFAALWGLIFIGVIAVGGLWEDVERNVTSRQAVFDDGNGRIEIPKARDNHYHLEIQVNGEPVRFIVDTGATGIVLTRKDARKVGINPNRLAYMGKASTANGVVRTALVRLAEMEVGAIRDVNVAAWVNEGDQEKSLLGMEYLNRFDQITISGDTMILER